MTKSSARAIHPPGTSGLVRRGAGSCGGRSFCAMRRSLWSSPAGADRGTRDIRAHSGLAIVPVRWREYCYDTGTSPRDDTRRRKGSVGKTSRTGEKTSRTGDGNDTIQAEEVEPQRGTTVTKVRIETRALPGFLIPLFCDCCASLRPRLF